jgi:monoamine oxidase
MSTHTRRDALKLGAALLIAPASARPRAGKRVLVAGGGIGGLCCGYELMRRGHDVIVLEASGRTGGHVFTLREGLDDGLYADAGAEHFTNPGYDRYRAYVDEFALPYRYYPRREHIVRWINGTMHTEEMLADPKVLAKLGLNGREIDHVKAHTFPELAGLYYKPYLDAFRDEYKPFDAGLDHLDRISTTDLFRKDGASPGALEFIGGGGSALHSVWHAAILKLRGVPLFPTKVYRLVGGNQKLPDAFAARLGERVRLDSPVTRIEHGQTGVRVTCRGHSGAVTHEADYLVCAMSAVMLRQIPVSPAWPGGKHWALQNVPYYFDSRPVFQSKSKFWKRDGVSPNMEFGDRELNHVWPMCDEVETTRGLMVGTSTGPQSPEGALGGFRRRYPGRSEDIEKTLVHVWANNRWASACETLSYRPGELVKFWPALVEPQGRVHFCGAYADNLNWGMEAATRSANRVAAAIGDAT